MPSLCVSAAFGIVLMLASLLQADSASNRVFNNDEILIRAKRVIGPASQLTEVNKNKHFAFAVTLHGHVTKFGFGKKRVLGVPVPTFHRYGVHCGASILSENLVVTAAHCVLDKKGRIIADSTWRVYMFGARRKPGIWSRAVNSVSRLVGKITGRDPQDGMVAGRHAHVRSVHVHPSYDSKTLHNDIAVIRTSRMKLNQPGISALSLPSDSTQPASGTVCQYAGWGCVRPGAGTQSRILAVNFTVLPHGSCWNVYSRDDADLENWKSNLCVRGRQATLCSGDSGGGLVCQDPSNGRPFLAGIASSASDGTTPQAFPANFARVASYLDWLRTFGV